MVRASLWLLEITSCIHVYHIYHLRFTYQLNSHLSIEGSRLYTYVMLWRRANTRNVKGKLLPQTILLKCMRSSWQVPFKPVQTSDISIRPRTHGNVFLISIWTLLRSTLRLHRSSSQSANVYRHLTWKLFNPNSICIFLAVVCQVALICAFNPFSMHILYMGRHT